jgi:hypothetical protein
LSDATQRVDQDVAEPPGAGVCHLRVRRRWTVLDGAYSSTWMFFSRLISFRIFGQTLTVTSPR